MSGHEAEVSNPVQALRGLLRHGERCYFMPNGGNLGDTLIAAATVQQFDQAGLPWTFLRGHRNSVSPGDVLVFGGGGSLTSSYRGGIECVTSLLALGARVVVLPQSVNGHAEFWRDVDPLTVFCRDAESLRYLKQFPQVTALAAHDMAIGLNMSEEPFATMAGIASAVRTQSPQRHLIAFRRDGESAAQVPAESVDLSAAAHPQLFTTASLQAAACGFLGMLATYTSITTDRLHVAIGGGLLGIPTRLHDNSYGKNSAVYLASIRNRFPMVTLVTERQGSGGGVC